MNRRRVAVVALAAALTLTGAIGVFGATGLVPANDNPDDVTAPATDTPTDTPQVLAHDGDTLTLENDPEQILEGTTNLDAGVEVTIRLQSTDSTNPFIRQTTTTVNEDGHYETTVDLNNLDAGTQFRATVLHDGEELANVSGRIVEGSVTETEQSDDESDVLVYDGEALTLRSAPDQTVEGTTDLNAGTEVTVRLRSSESAHPFIKQTTPTISEDGRFEATFNMSDIEPGVTFTVTVRTDGQTVDKAPGEVAADVD